MRELFLLTAKKVFYVANVDEKQLGKRGQRPARQRAARATPKAEGAPVVVICAAAEAEIAALDPRSAPSSSRAWASRSRA